MNEVVTKVGGLGKECYRKNVGKVVFHNKYGKL